MEDMARHLYEKWAANMAKQGIECDTYKELSAEDRNAWDMLGQDMLRGGYNP